MQAPEAPVFILPQTASALLTHLIAEAHTLRASDIHIDPEREYVVIRFRIDGVLQIAHRIPRSYHKPLLTRIKIVSGLRIDEHFISQDGRFHTDTMLDVRVSIAPTFHGENAVLRLLASSGHTESIQSLGCRKEDSELLTQALERGSGMILATGPTGSGKTTFLYSLLRMLDTERYSVVTLEDPIEYSLPGIRQIPIRTEYGISFATGLRSVLRQDPDVLMLGEIRDAETAHLATQTALTGHLVLSTLHTTDAPSTLIRLLELGIAPYVVASTIDLIVAQRLVRRICAVCRRNHTPSPRVLEYIRGWTSEPTVSNEEFYIGSGCDTCSGTGYVGRIGVFELLNVTEDIGRAVTNHCSAKEIREQAYLAGMSSLARDGLHKARAGITSLEEVVRVAHG